MFLDRLFYIVFLKKLSILKTKKFTAQTVFKWDIIG